MICFRRLMAVGAVVAATAVLTFTNVRGEPGRDTKDRDKELKAFREGGVIPGTDKAGFRLEDELARCRFDDKNLILYQTVAGEVLFAAQVRPQVEAPADRPRDIVILLDTSASKAQGPLANALAIARALTDKLQPGDRVALFTVNTRIHNRTNGFKAPGSLADLWKDLANEYPSGAANLKQAIADATAAFPEQEGRQRVLVLLGDGNSIANPIDPNDRVALSRELVRREVAFFSVPLGNRLDPLNLHGFPNSTGGKVVRVESRETVETFVPRFLGALAVPVLYPSRLTLPGEVVEAFPAQLPPLRSDTPTLLVGKLKPGLKQFEYSITGRVAGKEVTVRTTEKLPEADAENFFLIGMVGQWKAEKDRPALMQANRALAFACDQNQMARLQLLTDAQFAMDANRFDVAVRLMEQTLELDPQCEQARFGIDLVKQIRDGKATRKDLAEKFRPRGDDVLIGFNGKITREEADPEPARPDAPAAPAPNRDVLADVKARQQVADQQALQTVNDNLARATRLVATQPDDAQDLLKTTLDGIQRNPDISERVRQSQADRLEKALAANAREGAQVKRRIAEGLALRAAADARLQQERIQRGGDDRIRVRMAEFHNLMNKARQELAYQVAQDLRADLIANGQGVPPSVTAGYEVGLRGYNLRELREIRRMTDERWLAVMLSVERSHIPFSDEPGVEFPSTARIKLITNYNSGRGFDNWRDWSEDRIKRYSTASFGPSMPAEAYRLRDLLGSQVNYLGLSDPKATLDDALKQLKVRYGMNYEINTRAFKYENLAEPEKAEIAADKEIPPIQGTLGSVLKRILSRLPNPSGATYLIRRDTVEITTNQFQAAEKTLRVYPVADLVHAIPGPGQFQQQNYINSGGTSLAGGSIIGGIQGGQLAGGLGGLGALGALGGGLGALGGGLGALGALGGGLGALGGGLGALGALGGGLGALGAGGLGALGALGAGGLGALGAGGLGALGALGAGGLGALGAGGLGALGAGGLGALGALGAGGLGGLGGIQGGIGGLAGAGGGLGGGLTGQGGFGLQNGSAQQSRQLIILIRQVVGKPSDWAVNYNPYTGLPINPLEMTDGQDPLKGEDNQLGYYDPALALVVKGSSHITARATSPVTTGTAPPVGMGFLDGQGGVRVADNGRMIRVGGAGDQQPDPRVNLDPKVLWQDALARGANEPGLIIAVADFLALNRKFDHAAEFLKANLRQGIVVRPWVYESLAVAMRESGGSAEEIERAEVAAADLEPGDARSFLRAAEAMKGNRNYGQALAFARQASLLEPNSPYAYDSALEYAELAQDPRAMAWAAGNLLGKDWPARDKELKARASQKLKALTAALKTTDAPAAQKLEAEVVTQKQRDLAVKLSWQNEADLNLKVQEPCGSTCSPLNRQTVGGGILVGDPLEERSEAYLAAQAFSGTYKVTVERVWGQPLGNKASLTIIRHQGTPQQTEEIITVDLSKGNRTFEIKLDGGRRTETAYVPPPSRQDSRVLVSATPSTDQVLSQLRDLADPEMTGNTRTMRGSAGTMGAMVPPTQPKVSDPTPGDRLVYQTRVSSFVRNSVDVTAQVVLAEDRRSIRVSLTPVFDTSTLAQRPTVNNPLIPGGGN